ncbi:MAG: carboxypeptidase-like regulatory domain-containing protein [Armatimonadia bacterium]
MRDLVLVLLILTVCLLAGCGGGGKSAVTPTGNGSITGQVAGPNPSECNLVLDGTELDVHPGSDGSFTIPNLPAGNHYLSIISDDGLVGTHLVVDVDPDETSDLGDITLQPGGQIAGLVMQKDEVGNLSPLAGVTVVADPEPVYIMDGQTSTDPPASDGEELALRAITNDNGSYVIPAVPEGAYVVTVNVPGLVQGVAYVWVSAGTTATADFQLVPAIEEGVGTVRGTIRGTGDTTPAGTAIEGVTVTITCNGNWQPISPEPLPIPVALIGKALVPKQATGIVCPPYWFNQFTTLTDQNGEYSLNVPSGYLSISVWAEGYEGAYGSFSLQPRQTVVKDYTLAVQSDPPVVIQ